MKVEEEQGKGEAVALLGIVVDGVASEVLDALEVSEAVVPGVSEGTGLAQGEGLLEVVPCREGPGVAVPEWDAVPKGDAESVVVSLGEAEMEGLREFEAVALGETAPLRLLLGVGVAVLDVQMLACSD